MTDITLNENELYMHRNQAPEDYVGSYQEYVDEMNREWWD